MPYGDDVFYTVSVPGTEEYPWRHYLLALDASTGRINWRYPVEENVNTSALEHDGTIYFGTYGVGPDFLYGVDPETGELRHQYSLTMRSIRHAPHRGRSILHKCGLGNSAGAGLVHRGGKVGLPAGRQAVKNTRHD